MLFLCALVHSAQPAINDTLRKATGGCRRPCLGQARNYFAAKQWRYRVSVGVGCSAFESLACRPRAALLGEVEAGTRATGPNGRQKGSERENPHVDVGTCAAVKT